MSNQQSNGGNNAGNGGNNGGSTGNGQAVSTAIGGVTSGEAGATPGHETMAETGGSGGDALTQPRDIETAPLSGSGQSSDGAGAGDGVPEGAGTAATTIARGYQDTRGSQAGPGSTGLGTPETGGNQNEGDVTPPSR
jgi:hypothetical protein